MEASTLIIVFLIGFSTAIFGIMVGGSGLVRIPLLILIGLPPHIAIASNRIGSIAMCLTGIYKYGKEKLIDFKIGSKLIVLEIIGAFIGVQILLSLSAEIIQKVIGIAIVLIIAIMLINKNLGLEKKKVSQKRKILGILLYIPLSIYGGFAAGGGGTLQTIILISFFGLTFLESAATRRLPGIIGAIVAVLFFTYYRLINWPIAITLFISQMIGAWFGSSIAIKKGNKFVKAVFVIISIGLAIKLLIS